ncbi:MAG TPA: metalloregulator ArsR/SmtB family transcription factor [Thermomicrobiaceae bacterium]|nr:metalloregulator ArsR/SmtB family transcription factor [Thermomicrobiaceae bacterium]
MIDHERETETERELYRLQADICQVLADPTRLQILALLEGGTRAVKELVTATGQRQARISQHLALMRQRGIVQAERVGNEVHYSLTDRRILDACHVTRALLLRHLEHQGTLAGGRLDPVAQAE